MFLSQINDKESITPISPPDLDSLTSGGYVVLATKEEYQKEVAEVARLTDLVAQVGDKRSDVESATTALNLDEDKEHSFLFHFEGEKEKEELRERLQTEAPELSREQAELTEMEANLSGLIQEKSVVDRMVPYGAGYVSITGLGTVILNDLSVRDYRVSDLEFSEFVGEIRSTYTELRGIADRASSFVNQIKRFVPSIEEAEDSGERGPEVDKFIAQGRSLVWGTAIGLAKLQGDPAATEQRFSDAFNSLWTFNSTVPNKLMAAEIMTSLGGQDIPSLHQTLESLDKSVREEGVSKDDSAGVAATIMAGRRYDGTYPTDNFAQFRKLTNSSEAAAILAVMNVPFADLSKKFQEFETTFKSWGYSQSEDTEIASAFLALGELQPEEVDAKLKYVVEQLHNYLEYPLVAAAILASIPVFEAHEVLDLMEKAVTLLAAYTSGLERSEMVALAVRMIHGVRNELVKEIDPTAKVTETPIQFTYPVHPGIFFWYGPVIIAHSYYHATFGGMGGFHPAHSHGVGGFTG